MTTRSACRVLALALATTVFQMAFAQPVAPLTGTPVTAPARADIALRGNMIGNRQLRTQAECQAACEGLKACGGYTFFVPGYGREAPKANCSLYSDTLVDVPLAGVVSCRMPCVVPPVGLIAHPVKTPVPGSPMALHPAAALVATPATGLLLAKPTTVAPPAPPPAPLAKPSPARSAAPAATQRVALSGYEIVAGPWVDVAPLSLATTSAQCATGKVALSAGVDFNAAGDASFGLEVRGAIPNGRVGTVAVRNANVFANAKARALAVCVNAVPGLRAVDMTASDLSAASSAERRDAGCNAGERLVGGGVMGREQTVMAANGPLATSVNSAVWQQLAAPASPVALPGTVGVEGRALCAPESAVDGWEFVDVPEVSLGARSQTTLTLSCSAGKVVLAAGVLQRSANVLDMVANTLLPTQNGSVSAHLHNRNTLGTGGNVRAALTAVCASHQ